MLSEGEADKKEAAAEKMRGEAQAAAKDTMPEI